MKLNTTERIITTIGLIDTGISMTLGLKDAVCFIGNNDNKVEGNTPHGDITGQIILDNIQDGFRSDVKLNAVNIQGEKNILLDMLLGLDQLYTLGTKVICLPVGMEKQSPVFNRAIEALVEQDTLLICPSGNKGDGKVLSPGIHPEVLCVGAVDQNHQVASFSGRVMNKKGVCVKPELLAEGVDVEVQFEDGDVQRVSGTSFACAQVAGSVAALYDANPSATDYDVKMALYESCMPAYGSRYGVVNADKALENICIKVPYARKDEVTEIPTFSDEKYIDYRLKSQCEEARKHNKPIEGLVSAKSTLTLIERLAQQNGDLLIACNPFKNFDMVNITALPAFYDILFEQPDVEICHAVDINYFDL